MTQSLPYVAHAATDGDGLVKRTRRPALSCVECRVRKVKCDRKKPCKACIGIKSETCTYRSSRNANRAYRELSPGSTSGSRGNNRSSTQSFPSEHSPIGNQHTATDVLDLQTRPNTTSSNKSGMETSPRAEDRAKFLIHTLLIENERLRSTNIRDTGLESSTLPVAEIVTDIPGTFQKSKFFGQSHWMNALEPYTALGETNTTVNPATDRVEVNKSTELYKTVNELKAMARILKKARMLLPTIAPEALSSLPSKILCDTLVDCYLRTFEGVFRVLHVPSFRKEYEQYWSDRSQSKSSVSLKVMLVCAIGVPFYTGIDQPRLRVTCAKWIQAAENWLAAPHAKSRLNMAGLQIQILVVLAKQVCNVEGDHVWISAGSLLRTAMYLGLHRDPTYFGKINPFHAEMRRRLWATILELTAQTSMDMGMPPMVSERNYDTKPPSNVNDDDLSEENDVPLSIKPADVCTDCSVQIAFTESLPMRLEVIRLINGLHFNLAYRDCLKLGAELTKLCEEKTSFLKEALKKGAHITPFQIKLLDSLVRRFVLGLHRPFFAKAKNDPQYHYSRKVCLDASLAIFAPATASVAGVEDDWTLMTYRAVGFFKGLILYATSTIYFELNSQIEEHQTLSNLTAPLISGTPAQQCCTLPPQSQILYNALLDAHHKALSRLRNGETNPKGVVFFACATARIDALVAGTDPEAKVLETAKTSVAEMRRIMADVYEQEHGESINLSTSRIRNRDHGRGDGADDITGQHLPTGTDANADVGMEMGSEFDLGSELGLDSQSILSAGMDFSSQFLQDPEWFFDSRDWGNMMGDSTGFTWV